MTMDEVANLATKHIVENLPSRFIELKSDVRRQVVSALTEMVQYGSQNGYNVPLGIYLQLGRARAFSQKEIQFRPQAFSNRQAFGERGKTNALLNNTADDAIFMVFFVPDSNGVTHVDHGCMADRHGVPAAALHYRRPKKNDKSRVSYWRYYRPNVGRKGCAVRTRSDFHGWFGR